MVADAYRDLGYLEEAEHAYRRVTRAVPEHASGWGGLAVVLFDQLDFEGAGRAALRGLRLDPLCAEAAHVRGLLRQRRDDLAGAERDLLRAHRSDPLRYLRPVPLTKAMIEAVVEEASRALHPAIRSFLQQVPILVENVPSEEVCRQFDPPAPPGELLGLFNGYGLAGRAADDPWSQLPSTIVLFRCNLERKAADRAHLLEELRITVLHEVGHVLGLDEDDVEARGLE